LIFNNLARRMSVANRCSSLTEHNGSTTDSRKSTATSRPLLVLVGPTGYSTGMTWQGTITLEPGKRGGRPCVRHMRITVADVLCWLAAGMSHQEILSDYPELTEADIRACLSYAADRERGVLTAA
jgi:uncharacterized protein (DUF433 family)